MKAVYRGWHSQKRIMFSPEEMARDQLTLMPDGSGFINVSSTHTRLSIPLDPEIFIPLAYIGLDASEGDRIFMGDIIRYRESMLDNWNIGVVSYHADKGYPAFDVVPEVDCDSNGLSYIKACCDIEIMGNIYQNPEMDRSVL